MAIDSGKKDKEPDVEEILDELEKRVDRLKVLYEQYFMGIEKMEPQTARKEVARKILELTQMNLRNTALRYRFNALNQKWGVYITYWNRVTREIEKGTYFRSVARVGRDAIRKGQDIPDEVLRAMPERMRAQILKQREQLLEKQRRDDALRAEREAAKAHLRGEAPPPPPTPAATGVKGSTKIGEDESRMFDADMSFDEAFEQLFDNLGGEGTKTGGKVVPPAPPSRPPPPPRAAAAPPPPRPAAPRLPPGMDEGSTKALYQKYVQAKKLVGEDASGVKYEHIVATINKQAPKILEQHKASGVEFNVVIKDNKVILKAIPKK